VNWGGLTRAPEILLGQDLYSEAVDMWSVGCIFGELLRNEPLFPAKSEIEMLEHMTRLLGRPHEGIWPVWGPPVLSAA
jgi:serine/threonine protein kinase